ncbi:hypothetical protein CC86DRAFT_33624 [Ophiobolus disseminans]|uniref:25S rRNA (Uridine(2843)-N(3))-methyltransferase n=1 Tax=Ophiobolus disseminans TaxID=1469910 RepID=A0A6A6ZYN1_9PLEO|nr:hypothetical protein CC86DRAFT_33624 [Ophiobolus disseminans]
MPPPRPRWETNKKQPPPKVQKLQKTQKAKTSDEVSAPSISLERQQLILDIFKYSFAKRFAEDIKPLLQEIKTHLYNRDFATAFGKNEYLETYAARWSASRALGYADLFWDLRTHFWPVKSIDEESGARKIVCLGGGAGAELVALAGVQDLIIHDEMLPSSTMEVIAVDIADWTLVLYELTKHATTAPTLSKYASAAIQAANAPLIAAGNLAVSLQKHDILNTDSATLTTMLGDATHVTLMFTLNELYSTSVPLTQKFLLNLTSILSAGAILLVVDSPGSYSTITLNGAEKKYPMQWLLDHTLLSQVDGKGTKKEMNVKAKWDKIYDNESRWFRLNPELRYPIELENMRMQVHLYRRL